MFSSSRALTNTNTQTTSDAYFNNIILLLHGDGTNGAQNITYADNSLWSNTVYRSTGNFFDSQGSFTPYSPQGYSVYYDGTASYLTLPYSTTYYDWWTGNYTIEAWIWPFTFTGWYDSTTTTIPCLVGNMSATASNLYWSFGINSTGQVQFCYYNGSNIYVNSTNTVNSGKWNHIAMTCDGTNIYLFVNGVGTTATAISGTPQSSTSYTLTIGSYYNVTHTSNFIKGYVRDLRIVKGTAVYSGVSYTQPAYPLTAITNTSLLLNKNNFTDASIYDTTVTVVGYPYIWPGGPYTNLPTYSPSYHSGCAYQGSATSNYLRSGLSSSSGTVSYHLNMGTNDFTCEAWVYAPGTAVNTAASSLSQLFGLSQANASYKNLAIGYNPGGALSITSGNMSQQAYTTTRNFYSNCWNHIAFSRVAGYSKVFLNGKAVIDGLDETVYSSAGIQVGGLTALAGSYVYITDFRITNGKGLYTTNFTPPTQALQMDNLTNVYSPAYYNTSYAAVFVSGNTLTWTNSNTTALNVTNGFCIEFWMWMGSLPSNLNAILGSGSNNLVFSLSTTQFQLSNSGYYSITGTIPKAINAVWTHVAIIGSTYNYVAFDGVVVATNDVGGSNGSTHNGIWNYNNSFNPAFSCYVRDFRINIGSPVYNVNGFARPPQPLTVLPTTQLLTFTTSSLLDVSNNSTALTNTGFSFTAALGNGPTSVFAPFYEFPSTTVMMLNFNNNLGVYDSTGKNIITAGTAGWSAMGTNVTISTAQSKWGGGSILFAGVTSAFLRIPNSPQWDFGSSDFIVEFWVYLNAVGTAQTILSKKTSGTGFGPFQINVNASNQVTLNISTNGTSYSTSTVTGVTLATSTWYYVACWRSGNVAYASVNGTIGSAITGLSTTAVTSNAADVVIGVTSYGTASQAFNGYLDDFRVTVGTSRGYTTTAPATPTSAFVNQ